MRFRRRSEKAGKRDWRWKGKRIEVKELKYLGYVMQRNGGQKEHERDAIRKTAMAIRQV